MIKTIGEYETFGIFLDLYRAEYLFEFFETCTGNSIRTYQAVYTKITIMDLFSKIATIRKEWCRCAVHLILVTVPQ